MDKTTKNSEEEISPDNYPFIKLGFIIGITYGLILLISDAILIHLLKIYSLRPILYIAVYIDIIYILIYAIYVFYAIFDMTEKSLEKPSRNNNESKDKGKN